MAQNFPGSKGNPERSAPYHKTYSSFAAAVNLTTEIDQAQCATSGLFVVVATGGTLVWKDCRGVTNTVTLPIGVFDMWWCAATSLEISTLVGSVTAVWHGSGART